MIKIYEIYDVVVTKTTYVVKQPKVKKLSWYDKVKEDYLNSYKKPKKGYTISVWM